MNGTLELEPGQAIDAVFGATPAGTKFKAVGLPEGLTLTEAGRLSGKAAKTGTYPVILTATAPDGTEKTASFVVKVAEAAEERGGDKSSGGCDAGAGGLCVAMSAAAFLRKRRG
ncbi:MAG: putative Ig domain-containing protein [Synergistaceae bacterium]|nr:putative Ig domain-containing protein [Synergistaceae bacterium]